MKEPSNQEFTILRLIHAIQLDDHTLHSPVLPDASSKDMLLIVVKSASPRWQSGHAYFNTVEASDREEIRIALGQVEGFLFLVEQQTDDRIHPVETFQPVTMPLLLCEKIVSYANAQDALERFRGHVYFQELLYELYRLQNLQKLDARTAVLHTKTHMDNHYAEEMSIEGLAAMAQVSPSYYMELFKKNVGRSPIDYLTSVRIEAAKRLLDRSDAPAIQVSQSVGYRDPFYFSRQFKRVTGVSPSHYARRSAQRIASFHYPMTGQMLALQNIPYAAPLDREFSTFYKQQYEQQISVHLLDPSIKTNLTSNIAALQEAQPDIVIAGDWLSPSDQKALNRIASTLYVPWWEKDWRAHLLIVADFLGETAQAERWLQRYEMQAKHARTRLQNRLGESDVMAIHIQQGQIHRFGNRNLGTVLYTDLQLRPTVTFSTEKGYDPLTAEQLITLNPNRLLAAVGDDKPSKDLWSSLTRRPEWRALDAVKNHHLYRIQPDPWFEYSALGNARILKAIVKLFTLDRPS